jgi:hypothetical protein
LIFVTSYATRRFKFKKRRQLFIRSHNKTLSVAAVRVSNPDCSPAGIYRRDAAPTPTGFAEMVGDNFPVPHCMTTSQVTEESGAGVL